MRGSIAEHPSVRPVEEVRLGEYTVHRLLRLVGQAQVMCMQITNKLFFGRGVCIELREKTLKLRVVIFVRWGV